MRGRAAWPDKGLEARGIVTVHHGHRAEIEVISDTAATGIWSMTDRLFMPAASPLARITGFGHYHETYEKVGGAWCIKTLRISRLRVEAA